MIGLHYRFLEEGEFFQPNEMESLYQGDEMHFVGLVVDSVAIKDGRFAIEIQFRHVAANIYPILRFISFKPLRKTDTKSGRGSTKPDKAVEHLKTLGYF